MSTTYKQIDVCAGGKGYTFYEARFEIINGILRVYEDGHLVGLFKGHYAMALSLPK